ncbi:TonB-dependent receptor [Paracoccus sp. SCSIO 75233]|uniref:TonB-dependent receptor family protein n=1 Tax=Paracoccus sp. SCSIO 75233 TaxID=3017782 RepID=UPI0022F03DC5|nr:TonB-dependent receptor [Paracoccus sp. SCSIO 75233]WBU53994.1 TonB-dependent receptor [Paracoccus sp. SCSIO 75233]
MANDIRRFYSRKGLALSKLLAGAALICSPAFSQSVAPGAVIVLDPIILHAENPDDLRFAVTPGGVTRIDRGDTPRSEVAPKLSDALSSVPGVVTQEFFGGNDQPRIQIRGSGQQQNPAERGLLVLMDGMPVNRADGAYVVGLASPGQAETLEILRGSSANRLGATVLGGAINLVSPSGASAPGMRLSFGGGSFERSDLVASYGVDGPRADTLLRFEHSQSDGYRDYNSSARTSIGGNVSLQTGAATTRLFLSHTSLEFDIAGPLTWNAVQNDPESNHTGPVIVAGRPTNPGPNVLRDRPKRKTDQTMAGMRSTWEDGPHTYDLGFSLSRTDDSFGFPVSAGFRDTDSTDATLIARYTMQGKGDLPLFEAGLSWSRGEADRDYYHNLNGRRGPAFGSNRLKSGSLSLYAGGNMELGEFTLSPSLAYIYATRENDDLWNAATRPTAGFNPMNPSLPLPAIPVPSAKTDYDRSYSGLAPSVALSWRPAERQLAWVSLSKSFEPPTHDDLLGTINGTANTGPGRPSPVSTGALFATPDLDAQESVTLEIGWRGETDRFAWDATAYHSRLKNELLSLRDVTGAARASVNADRTIHSGIELGLSGELTPDLSTRLAWTWQDFRFDDDPMRGDNRLAGAPRNVISLAMDWQATERFAVGGKLHWVPEETPVDNMNTVFNDPYALVDVSASYALSDQAEIFGRVTNLFDERYASSTLVVDQAMPQQAAFIPGEGRAFYLGTRLRF